jgi:hypothetical protein
VTTGLATSTPLARKLWAVATIQGHKNPFGKPILEYNLAELDFILEMEALNNPREFTFHRDGIASDGSHIPEAKAAWSRVLRGSALTKFFSNLPFDAIRKAKERHFGSGGSGLKPGVMMPRRSGVRRPDAPDNNQG